MLWQKESRLPNIHLRLMVRGGAGVVTDGGFRDSADIAKLAIPAFHSRPSAPTNLTLHQAKRCHHLAWFVYGLPSLVRGRAA